MPCLEPAKIGCSSFSDVERWKCFKQMPDKWKIWIYWTNVCSRGPGVNSLWRRNPLCFCDYCSLACAWQCKPWNCITQMYTQSVSIIWMLARQSFHHDTDDARFWSVCLLSDPSLDAGWRPDPRDNELSRDVSPSRALDLDLRPLLKSFLRLPPNDLDFFRFGVPGSCGRTRSRSSLDFGPYAGSGGRRYAPSLILDEDRSAE